jgi:hypothetical protein
MHQTVAGNERAILHYTCPPTSTPLAMMMWSPSRELCPMWQWAIRKLCEPTTVSPSGFGRAMNGDVFAEHVVIADAQARRLTLVFQILRRVADDTAGVKHDCARRSSSVP